MKHLVLATLISVLAPGVAIAQSAVRHPDAANLAAPPGTVVIARSVGTPRAVSVAAAVADLRSLVVVDSVGAEEGPESFGIIADVALRGQRIAILDRANFSMTLLDEALRPLLTVGRLGAGPLEFRSPVGLAFESDTVIRVLDGVLGLKRFSLNESDSSAQLLVAAALPVAVMSACLSSDELVALAPSSLRGGSSSQGDVEPLLTVLTAPGEIVRSFGDSYRSPRALARRIMSEGVVGCSPRGTAVVGFSSLPFVRVYDARGRLTQTFQLSDFAFATTLEGPNERGQIAIGLDPNTRDWSSTERIAHLRDGLFAVQVAHRRVNARARSIDLLRLDTYVIDEVSGEGVFVGSELPFLAGAGDGWAVGFSNEDVPKLYRLGRR